jgi:hypothetical protein
MNRFGVIATCIALTTASQTNGQSPQGNVPRTQTTEGNCSPIINGSNNQSHCIISTPPQTKEQRLAELRKRTEGLAAQLFDFMYASEGPLGSLQSYDIALSFINNPDVTRRAQEKLKARNERIQETFSTAYQPRLNTLLDELTASGVDTSPVTRAIARGNIRAISLMLSVVAYKMGSRPPSERTLTRLEAREIIQGFGPVGNVPMEVYADATDPNSVKIAETLRSEFERQRWTVNKQVLRVPTTRDRQRGIHMVFPSGDLEYNFQGMVATFQLCEFEFKIEFKQAIKIPLVMRIEVWPGTQQDPIMIGPPSLIDAH